MGLLTYTFTGGALLLIGACESLFSTTESFSTQTTNQPSKKTSSLSLTIKSLSIAILSVTFILNSFISLSDASRSKDKTGLSLQLQEISIALLFLLCSLLGILSNTLATFKFPLKLLNLMYVFAFGEEFLLFYIQKKDPSGIENRYYDLILVPVAICLFSTILELMDTKSVYPKLGRGVGFVLQGMWTLQMGFSFFSNMIANGCDLHEKSRGNFTIKCKGHMEYHRGRAIAVLQFNCHLALLVTLVAVVYTVFCKKYSISRESLRYKPLGEMQFNGNSQFSLDTDDEDDDVDVIKEVGKSLEMQKAIVVVPDSGVNGHGSHV